MLSEMSNPINNCGALFEISNQTNKFGLKKKSYSNWTLKKSKEKPNLCSLSLKNWLIFSLNRILLAINWSMKWLKTLSISRKTSQWLRFFAILVWRNVTGRKFQRWLALKSILRKKIPKWPLKQLYNTN